MKKIVITIVITFICLCTPFYALAHPGRTDANGGHNDRSNGTYHFHHGYPAHSHAGGTCPYDYDDQTDHGSSNFNSNSNSNSNSSSKFSPDSNSDYLPGISNNSPYSSKNNSSKITLKNIFTAIFSFIICIIVFLVIFVLPSLFFEWLATGDANNKKYRLPIYIFKINPKDFKERKKTSYKNQLKDYYDYLDFTSQK